MRITLQGAISFNKSTCKMIGYHRTINFERNQFWLPKSHKDESISGGLWVIHSCERQGGAEDHSCVREPIEQRERWRLGMGGVFGVLFLCPMQCAHICLRHP